MAHTTVGKKQDKYGVFNYMIRAKLFKGLKTMTMKLILNMETNKNAL